jgi:hypothetical protein
MADTPCWSGPLPVLFTGAFQSRHYDAGQPGGIDVTAFSALANPPAASTFITAANFASLPAVGAGGRAYKTTDNGKRWIWGGYGYIEVKQLDGTSYS